MRVPYIISLLILFSACKDSTHDAKLTAESGFKIMVIPKLHDTTFTCVPAYYDTSFTWYDTSECRYSAETKVRFQPKKLKTLKENCNGSSYLPISVDTVDRITVTYSKYSYPEEGSDSASIIQHHYRTREENIISDAMYSDIPYDTLEHINGRLYSIILFTYSNPRTSQYGKKIAAATIIKNNLISFSYETFSDKNDLSNEEFIRNSKFYLARSQPSNGR